MIFYIRMVAYLIFGVLAGQGLVIFDQAAGTVTFKVEDLVTIVSGFAGFAATFAVSRVAKARGGKT